jgi:hypothetical protein
MIWSNEALNFEEKWYREIKKIHQDLEKEIADNLANLKTDENGVLHEDSRTTPILFDQTKAVDRMEAKGKELMIETFSYFWEKGRNVKQG